MYLQEVHNSLPTISRNSIALSFQVPAPLTSRRTPNIRPAHSRSTATSAGPSHSEHVRTVRQTTTVSNHPSGSVWPQSVAAAVRNNHRLLPHAVSAVSLWRTHRTSPADGRALMGHQSSVHTNGNTGKRQTSGGGTEAANVRTMVQLASLLGKVTGRPPVVLRTIAGGGMQSQKPRVG